MAMTQGRQSRCVCTLPFSLHLTVLILGIVGIILSIVATVLIFHIHDQWTYKSNGSSGSAKGTAFWLLVTTILIFVSGLQGLLIRNGSKWFISFIVLAVIVLIDLGVFIVAVIFVGSPFWIIYMIAVFVLELWVTIVRTCCKTKEAGVVGTEVPVANPEVQGYAVDMPASGQAYPPIYQVDPRPEFDGLKAPGHHGQGRNYDQFEDVR